MALDNTSNVFNQAQPKRSSQVGDQLQRDIDSAVAARKSSGNVTFGRRRPESSSQNISRESEDVLRQREAQALAAQQEIEKQRQQVQAAKDAAQRADASRTIQGQVSTGNTLGALRSNQLPTNLLSSSDNNSNLPFNSRVSSGSIKTIDLGTTANFNTFESSLFREKTGEYIDPSTGRSTPVFSNVKVFDPKGQSFAEGSVSTVRDATPEEIAYFESEIKSRKEVQASTEKVNKLVTGFGEVKGKAGSLLYETNKESSLLLSDVGINKKNTQGAANVLTSLIPLSYVSEGSRDFIYGGTNEALQSVREKPFSNVAVFGTGYAVGAAFEGAPIVVKTVGKAIGVPKAEAVASFTKGSANVVGLGLGAQYTLQTTGNIINAPTYEEKGAVFGAATKEAALFIYGGSKGAKGALQAQGEIATFGRKYVDIKQGEYPTAPVDKQLDLFKNNINKELSDKPGAFHTTSDIFFRDGKITPKAGSSELPGLYASTQISTPFSRISGSNAPAEFDIANIIKKAVTVSEPGVAYIVPEGFRKVKTSRVNPYEVDDQTFKLVFNEKPKPGYLDVPGIKTEIEAIARVDAGSYIRTSKGFYTEINGIKVPVDIFKFDPFSTPRNSIRTSRSRARQDTLADISYSNVSPSSLRFAPTSNIYGGSSRISSRVSRSSPLRSSSSTNSASNSIYGSSSRGSSNIYSSILPRSSGSSGASSVRSPPSPGSSILRPPRIVPPFKRLKRDEGTFDQMLPKRKSTIKQPTAYQPSFTAVVFGIKGNPAAGAGAFRVRPIVERQKRKRRK